MVHFSAFVVLISALAASALPFNKRTVAQVESDIATINSQLTTLNSAINSFPDSGRSLTQAWAIHMDSVNLASAITQATTDVTSTGAFSDADATTILHSVEAIQPTIIDALNTVVAKKAAFQGLPIGGVMALQAIKQDIDALTGRINASANALLNATSRDLQEVVERLQASINDALNATASVFANA
ncbi:hydrophobic surface binding protein A-domain-containing protein [Gautieria morchelliformis]|nr:hydrophobic surface binding protein A-domain-containing protein [Gautieria morchelliformis]